MNVIYIYIAKSQDNHVPEMFEPFIIYHRFHPSKINIWLSEGSPFCLKTDNSRYLINFSSKEMPCRNDSRVSEQIFTSSFTWDIVDGHFERLIKLNRSNYSSSEMKMLLGLITWLLRWFACSRTIFGKRQWFKTRISWLASLFLSIVTVSPKNKAIRLYNMIRSFNYVQNSSSFRINRPFLLLNQLWARNRLLGWIISLSLFVT